MTGRLWVFAGPNGAGKTTLVSRLIGNRLPVINPDELIDPASRTDRAAQLGAGRKAVAARAHLVADGLSFAIETTLSGRTEIDLVRSAQAARYRVSLVYIGLSDVQLSIGRVQSRVANGGHDVPMADLFRRFNRSLHGLAAVAPIVNRLILVDNSNTRPRLLFWRDESQIRRSATNLPVWTQGLVLRPDK